MQMDTRGGAAADPDLGWRLVGQAGLRRPQPFADDLNLHRAVGSEFVIQEQHNDEQQQRGDQRPQ